MDRIVFQTMECEKRTRKETNKFAEVNPIGYLLFFFKDDKSYELLTTNSLLLPPTFDFDNAQTKDSFKLKHNIDARLLAKSTDEADIKRYQRQLEKRLQQNKPLNVTNESLNFFHNDSQDKEMTDEETHQSTDEIEVEETFNEQDTSEVNDRTESEIDGTGDHRPLHKNTFVSSSDNGSASNGAILHQLQLNAKYLKSSLRVQEKIYNELKMCRKHLTKDGRSRFAAPSPQKVPVVMYKGENLTKLGDNNMDMSLYGVTLARRLFTDEEIMSAMLFPQRSTARPSLSPTRSQIFREAVTARFGDEDIKEAVVAVNCLGNDLKRGKRKRRELL